MLRYRKPCRSNQHERKVCKQLTAKGWKVLMRGWPDIIAVKGDQVRLIEVKPPTSTAHLKPQQQNVADALLKAGLVVELAKGSLDDCTDYRKSIPARFRGGLQGVRYSSYETDR